MSEQAPSIDEIRGFREKIASRIVKTPVIPCHWTVGSLPPGTPVFGKLEFLQKTGTFKARGALANVLSLDSAQLERGVCAVSAGNHAIATAFAAREAGTSAKVVMLEHSNEARKQRCREFGAEVVLAKDVHAAFEAVKAIEAAEGRYFVHPFEGRSVALGTGTVGLEMVEQCPEFDALVVPVGGGGLIAGIANAVRQLKPDCRIIGVEPVGADTMRRSFESGVPEAIEQVNTIADSLGAPFAMPYSFALTRDNVDALVQVDDTALSNMMGRLFTDMKIAVEPACAAAAAALLGPLREELGGATVMLTFCGSNIDWPTFGDMVRFDRG
ncbi:MAG: pyridoxal-phosphate dependent enzyme [Pseudomonadota bacterium]